MSTSSGPGNAQRVTSSHVDALVQELAEAAQLEPEQARSVLNVLHIDKLVVNANELQKLLSNSSSVSALGFSAGEVQNRLDSASAGGFTLANLRLAIKPAGAGMVGEVALPPV
jgi:hypothetical protein